MEMTMSGVVLSIVISGGVALFIAHNFFRARMGLGLAVMFFLPAVSCAAYIYLTAPYFNPVHVVEKVEASPAATFDEIEAMEQRVANNPKDMDAVLILVGYYMSRENYDATIALLVEKTALFPNNNDVFLQLSTAYFAKGLLRAENALYTEALELLETALEIAPSEAPFLPDLKHFIRMIEKEVGSEPAE